MLSSLTAGALDDRADHAEDTRPCHSTGLFRIMKSGTKSTIDFLSLATALAVAAVHHVAGQEPLDPRVQPAAFDQPATPASTQLVRFSRQAPHVGDEVEQNIGLEIRMTLTMRHGNEVTGKNQTTVRTRQQRIITTTGVTDGRMAAVKVSYPKATKQMSAAEGTDASAEPDPAPQPVQGKTYLCKRELGENGDLLISDEKGERPPTDEYEIVAQQMQMVGRSNPLARFLAGRTIAIGEKVELPLDIASQIFNLGERFGKVTRFTLSLQKIESQGPATCAVFQAAVEAASNNSTQMRLEVVGPLVVDVATCRAQRISLLGPIGMSETRGTYSTAYQVLGTGRLQMSIASIYRDAPR